MKVTFMPGIESISGSMKSPTGKKLIFRHYQGDKSGHGHVYMHNSSDYQRKKPLSENEKAARKQFADVQRRIAALTTEEMSNYKRNFRDAQGKFRGKKYKTLRGYISAVIYNSIYSTAGKGYIMGK